MQERRAAAQTQPVSWFSRTPEYTTVGPYLWVLDRQPRHEAGTRHGQINNNQQQWALGDLSAIERT